MKSLQERKVKWYGHVMKRGALFRKKGAGNESTRKEEERKT